MCPFDLLILHGSRIFMMTFLVMSLLRLFSVMVFLIIRMSANPGLVCYVLTTLMLLLIFFLAALILVMASILALAAPTVLAANPPVLFAMSSPKVLLSALLTAVAAMILSVFIAFVIKFGSNRSL
jgi:hypothetical protein